MLSPSITEKSKQASPAICKVAFMRFFSFLKRARQFICDSVSLYLADVRRHIERERDRERERGREKERERERERMKERERERRREKEGLGKESKERRQNSSFLIREKD